jgi:hypothetical protein
MQMDELYTAVYHPFDDVQEEQEEGGTSVAMAVVEPDYHERGTVDAVTSAMKTKYKQKSAANSTSRLVSKPKKHQIARGKRVYVERRTVKK